MLKTNKSMRNPYTALAAGLALSGLLVAGSAGAVTVSDDLEVSATVTNNCTIVTAPLIFGAYDPVSANLTAPLDETGTVTVLCTEGSTFSITLDDGAHQDALTSDDVPLRRMLSGTVDFISYELHSGSVTGPLWSNTAATDVNDTGGATGGAQNFTVFGRILGGQVVPEGTYADTVVASVTF